MESTIDERAVGRPRDITEAVCGRSRHEYVDATGLPVVGVVLVAEARGEAADIVV